MKQYIDLAAVMGILLVLLIIFTLFALKGISNEIGFVREMIIFFGGSFAAILKQHTGTTVNTDSETTNILNKP